MTINACAALVERGDPDRFAATMAAPVAARAVLFPLYAFNLEVARAPWVTSEAMIAEMRLQWWRDAVEEVGAGKTPRAHEVMTPLADVIVAAELPLDVLDRMIAARRWDIYKDPFEDAAHFEEHIDATAGGLMWLAGKALGATGEAALRDFGYGAGVAAWLQAVPALEERGRLPFVDGRTEAVQAIAQTGLARLERGAKRMERAAKPAARAAWQAKTILRQAMADPRRVADGTLGQSDFAKRGSLLWKVLTGRI